MAGYRTAGANTFTNATTINDQMDRQREDYQDNNLARVGSELQNLGVARDTSRIFSSEWDPQEIISESFRFFKDLDRQSESGNPDFPRQISHSHEDTLSMFDNVSDQIDKPNKKGPNLIAPDINGSTFANNNQQTSQFTERGFGWRDQRNEPGTEPARIGEYFSAHYKIGSNIELNKPELGEAKSPDSDTNIQYDQP